jgi:hypothetical protein
MQVQHFPPLVNITEHDVETYHIVIWKLHNLIQSEHNDA